MGDYPSPGWGISQVLGCVWGGVILHALFLVFINSLWGHLHKHFSNSTSAYEKPFQNLQKL
jgi:hypothetical protein